ncbi:MAG: GtrA family protein [Hyphomicrobiaceae bacterium]|nr:GtrA family protein [Hyphomicrobiaceae bacterium]
MAPRAPDPAPGHSASRHWGGFLVSGAIAFAIDAAVMELGVRLLALPPLVARLAGIAIAMLGGWLAHRTLTFAVEQRPTLSELLRYAAAAWTTAGINYLCFAGLLLAWPSLGRLPALATASIVATIFSYLTMRYGVFRRNRG